MMMRYEIVSVTNIGEKMKQELFNLMNKYYEGMHRKYFFNDLDEKDSVILVKDDNNIICGFTTIMEIDTIVNGKKIWAIYSGDTIIEKSKWGSWAMFKGFGEVIKRFLDKRKTNTYWFLVSKGVKTYLLLPLFFKEFYPAYNRAPPKIILQIMHSLGRKKFGTHFYKEKGIIHYEPPRDRIRDNISDIPFSKWKEPHIKFFLERNPEYKIGDELVCLASIKLGNFTKEGIKMLGI